jgi:hypothetical protein
MGNRSMSFSWTFPRPSILHFVDAGIYKTVVCEDSNWGTDNFREVVDKGQEQKWAMN